MNEWPTGWFREDEPRAPHDGNAAPGAAEANAAPGGSAGASGAPGVANDPTVRLPARSGAGAAGGAGYTGAGTSAPAGPWPTQPPPRSAPGDPGNAPVAYGRGGRRARRPRLRLVLAFLAGLVVVLLILVIGGYFYLDGKLNRSNVLMSYARQPAAEAGSNWLITGSDSRQGLTRKQEKQLATGRGIAGHRSDTILILHMPSNGGSPVLISLPRDSYLPIPGFGSNKINAAYSFGGAKLLAETVQNATGLRIDHYMGIGFGGLVRVVDSVGGVNMCIKMPLRDPAAGLNLKRGCQTLDGAQALGYVRSRHLFANQDLQRIQDQRLFMKALLRKLTSPGVMLNPFAAIPAALGAASTLTVDQGTNLYQLIRVAFALRNPETTTVPIATGETLSVGDVLIWDNTKAAELFHALKTDQPVPKSLLTGSKQAGG